MIKLKFKIFILLVIFSIQVSANSLDSLRNIVTNQKDTAKISTLIKISEELNNIGDIEKSKYYAYLAVLAAVENGSKKHIALSEFQFGSSMIYTNQLDSAEILLNNSLNYFIENNLKQNISANYEKLGALYIYRANYSEAIKYLNNAILFGDSSINALVYNDKGIIFSNLADYASALEYFLMSLKYVKPTNSNAKFIAGIHNNIATVYIYSGDLELALKELKSANRNINKTDFKTLKISILNNLGNVFFQLNKIDSAEIYFNAAFDISKNFDNELSKVLSLINMAYFYTETGKFEVAEQYLEQTENILNKFPDIISLVQFHIHKSLLYEKTGEIQKALNQLENAVEICDENDLTEFKITIFQKIAKLYSKDENYQQAFFYQSEYQKLADTVFNLEKTNIIENLKSINQIEKQEQEIKYLKLKNKEQKENIVKIVVLSVLSVLLLSAFIYILLLKNRNTKQELVLINEKSKMNELEIEKEKAQNQAIKLELENREKEIFTKVNQIIQTNELIRVITQKLKFISKNVSPENQKVKKEIQKLLIQIKTQDRTQLWKEFETRFVSVHNKFYEKLTQNYPDLTPNERRLCAFLKLNMNTKDIASITLQSQNAIFVARNRLRKKLNIDTDENLTIFIQNL